jgi:hypothetical protein
MKKTKLILLLIALFANKITAQTQTFQWAKSIGGSANQNCYMNAIDANKNLYSVGAFSGTTDLDPGTGVVNVSPSGTDIFISKLDVDGNYKWGKRFGGVETDTGKCIGTDTSGNVYVSGQFGGTVDFDPSTAVFNLIGPDSNINTNVFILKLDSNGNFIWAKNVGSGGNVSISSMIVDAAGNTYFTGEFYYTPDFDPSPTGVASFTSNGLNDTYIEKLDSSGNFAWVRVLGNSDSNDSGRKLALDSSGNVYVTGTFSSTVDFDPGPGVTSLTTIGGLSTFVLKLNNSGNTIWVKQLAGQSYGITVDASNNVYTCGIFGGTKDFDPNGGVVNLTSTGAFWYDGYISKLDGNGNYVWVKQISGSFEEIPKNVAISSNNILYTVGLFGGTVNFNPSGSGANLTSVSGTDDIFIQKMDLSGNFIEVSTIGTSTDEILNSILMDQSNNYYLCGAYSGTVDFNTDPVNAFNLTSIISYDAFVTKYGVAILGLEDYTRIKKINFSVYPNPSKGQFHIDVDEFEESTTLEIHDILGQKLHDKKLNAQNLEMDFNLNKGIYFVSLINGSGKKSTKKIIIE